MRISTNFNATVLTLKSSEYNGNTFFKLGLITDSDDVGELSCTPDVASYVKKGKSYNFGFNINTDNPKVYINSVCDLA